MSISISLAISHTPWVPERIVSFNTLQASLSAANWAESRTFDERAHFSEWSHLMWSWAARQPVSHCLFLQDDVIVPPNFYEALYAMLLVQREEVICLEVVHPAAPALAAAGHKWFTTADGLVGVGYVLPRALLGEFLIWRDTALRDGAITQVPEDTLIALWCAATGRRVWHPIPTIIDHNTALESTYAELGNGEHGNRRPLVRWDTSPQHVPPADLGRTSTWTWSGSVPHLGRFYESTPRLLQEFLGECSAELVARVAADNGGAEKRRLTYLAKARQSAPTKRVFIATPTSGRVRAEYAASVWALLRDEAADYELPLEVVDARLRHADVCRTRAKLVHMFLAESDATHILFWDDDIQASPAAIRGMLAAGKHFVAAPYPRRDGVNYADVVSAMRADADGPPEAYAYKYSVRLGAEGVSVDGSDCLEIEGIGLGLALISREGMQRMVDNYRVDRLDYADLAAQWRDSFNDRASLIELLQDTARLARAFPPLQFNDAGTDVVSLFHLYIDTETGENLSEDFSFCRRWRASDLKIHMYLGTGSPVNHWGEMCFKGAIEAFGLKRVPK